MWLCGASGQAVFVPLVPVLNSTIILQTGLFNPNGTIGVGETKNFYIYVQNVPKGYGISVYQSIISSKCIIILLIFLIYALSMYSRSFYEVLNISMYLKYESYASALNYDDMAPVGCASPCITFF